MTQPKQTDQNEQYTESHYGAPRDPVVLGDLMHAFVHAPVDANAARTVAQGMTRAQAYARLRQILADRESSPESHDPDELTAVRAIAFAPETGAGQ